MRRKRKDDSSEFRFFGFDIETVLPIPREASDLGDPCALGIDSFGGISIVAVVTSSGDEHVWTPEKKSKDDDHFELLSMTSLQVQNSIEHMFHLFSVKHYIPVSWNGLFFDLRVLARCSESEKHAAMCRAMALGHVDLAFNMLARTGFMCSMDSAADFMLKVRKSFPSAIEALTLWSSRDSSKQREVVRYCVDDAKLVLQIFAKMVNESMRTKECPKLHYRSKKGIDFTVSFPEGVRVSMFVKQECEHKWESGVTFRSCLSWALGTEEK